MTKPIDMDAYISGFPQDTQQLLKQVRQTVKKAAPKAEEVISYGMPAFKLNGVLLYFAGYKNHIGFYPMPSAIVAFKKQISNYKWAKGSVQFPFDKPLPLKLIEKITTFRVKENLQKAALKQKNKDAFSERK
jgi:uncharacterized protein YdhG (YjbR/CyaY superfamily)